MSICVRGNFQTESDFAKKPRDGSVKAEGCSGFVFFSIIKISHLLKWNSALDPRFTKLPSCHHPFYMNHPYVEDKGVSNSKSVDCCD